MARNTEALLAMLCEVGLYCLIMHFISFEVAVLVALVGVQSAASRD